MSDPDYAAFDPIFFLHHANVDRLYALWEYIYPDYWMGTGYKNRQGRNANFIQAGSTWDNDKPNYAINETSDLRPFPISQSGNTLKHWTSNDTRFLNSSAKTPKFYTYPPIAGVSVETPEPTVAQREALRAKLQQHFGLNPIDDSKRVQSRSLLFTAPPPAPPPQTEAVPGWQRFFVDAELNPGVTDGSHMLELSAETATGTVPMGNVSVFSRGKNTKCAACKGKENDPDNRIHGIIPISTLAVDRILSADGYKPVNEKADMDHFVSKLHLKIRAAGPARKVLAHPVRGGKGHADEVHPVKRATLITAHVAKPAGNPEGVATFYNFREWADLNEGCSWRPGAAAAAGGSAQQPLHA